MIFTPTAKTMPTSKMAEIEKCLVAHGGWVSAAFLVDDFGLSDERELRATGDKPGLCSAFAISGKRGFRHVRCCTQQEFDEFYSRMRSHGIGELVRARRLMRARGKVVVNNVAVVDGRTFASEVAPFVPTIEGIPAVVHKDACKREGSRHPQNPVSKGELE